MRRVVQLIGFVAALLAAVLVVGGVAMPAEAATKVAMPHVVGKSADKAQRKLETKGLTVTFRATAEGPVFVASH